LACARVPIMCHGPTNTDNHPQSSPAQRTVFGPPPTQRHTVPWAPNSTCLVPELADRPPTSLQGTLAGWLASLFPSLRATTECTVRPQKPYLVARPAALWQSFECCAPSALGDTHTKGPARCASAAADAESGPQTHTLFGAGNARRGQFILSARAQ